MKNLQFLKIKDRIMKVEIANYLKDQTEIVIRTIINHLF
jgi:hypothetical protein